MLLSAVIVVRVRVPQALEDLIVYGKVRTEKRKWSVVQLIEVPKRLVVDQLTRDQSVINQFSISPSTHSLWARS